MLETGWILFGLAYFWGGLQTISRQWKTLTGPFTMFFVWLVWPVFGFDE